MDYEKKLALAKEALDSGSYDKETIEYIFPELKESEESEDEKIRKEIISHLKYLGKYCQESMPNVNEWIAWLEKQDKSSSKVHYWTEEEIEPIINDYLTGAEHYGGMIGRLRCLKPKYLEKQGKNNMGISEATKQELKDNLDKALEKETPESWNKFLDEQKSADKVEPKFHVGEWIIFNENKNSVYQVERIDNYRYYLRHYLGGSFSVHFDNELIRAWTIEDAKDGDVLACNEEILIFKSYSVQGRISLYCWYNGQTNNFHSKEVAGTSLTTRNKICPATKEQRDTLMKALTKAGYIFNFKKKELKKIESKFCKDDWVVNNNGEPKIYQVITRSWPDSKIKRAEDKLETFINTATLDKQYHLWTIQDAKDGDVLVASDDSIFLFKGTIDSACKHYVALTTNNVVKFNEGLEHYWETSRAVHPATKEQRDLLFAKMKDAGYTFDFEKKELKKIEEKPAIEMKTPEESLGIDSETYNKVVDECIYGEQEPEPKFKVGDIITPKDGGHEPWQVMQVEISDKKYRFKDGYVIPFSQEDDYKLVEQNPSWTEEDSYNKAWIVETLIGLDGDKMYSGTCKRMSKWLNSLKNRYTWNPTDEQMEAVKCAALDVSKFSSRSEQLRLENEPYYKALVSLYQDLKKLKGE